MRSSIFTNWQNSEASNPAWIYSAIQVKGFATWFDWRMHTANILQLPTRNWQLYTSSKPEIDVPKMLLGPFDSWQKRAKTVFSTRFEQLVQNPVQYAFFTQHAKIKQLMNDLPFAIQFIGLIHEQTGQIICIEGHHRAVAITVSAIQGTLYNWLPDQCNFALARIETSEFHTLHTLLHTKGMNPDNI